DDDDPYYAYVAAIQIIKYDGERPDPTVKDGADWVIPQKPLVDSAQDANTSAEAVRYEPSAENRVRWVVTNTGNTWLTNLTLVDTTEYGPAIGDDWTADLTEFGGPADYSFVENGVWDGLFPPGASFFAEGTLTLAAGGIHGNTVRVTGNPIMPE